jgi:sec-independent protein translocase protein TatA
MHGINEWVLILLVVLVIFGAGKLKNIGGDLGAAVKSFKEGLSGPKKKNESEIKEKIDKN